MNITSGPAPHERTHRGRGGGLPRVAAGVIAICAVLSACVDHDQQALCPAFAEYVTIADEIRAADPTGATAQDVRDDVELVRAELAQLRAVADQRYRAPIDELDRLLADLGRTLNSLQDDDEYSTWEPLVDDTLDDVAIADARLRRAIDPACQERHDNDNAAGSTGGEI